MKSLIASMVFGVGLLFVSAGIARAEVLEVNVPFAFTVGNQELPPGNYRLEPHSTSASVILLRGERGNKAGMFVQTTSLYRGNSTGNLPALVFIQSESGTRLAEIWESGSTGHEVSAPSKDSLEIGRIILRGELRS